jgi:hypothetical protein
MRRDLRTTCRGRQRACLAGGFYCRCRSRMAGTPDQESKGKQRVGCTGPVAGAVAGSPGRSGRGLLAALEHGCGPSDGDRREAAWRRFPHYSDRGSTLPMFFAAAQQRFLTPGRRFRPGRSAASRNGHRTDGRDEPGCCANRATWRIECAGPTGRTSKASAPRRRGAWGGAVAALCRLRRSWRRPGVRYRTQGARWGLPPRVTGRAWGGAGSRPGPLVRAGPGHLRRGAGAAGLRGCGADSGGGSDDRGPSIDAGD